jgi:hypothetical protein
VKKDLSSELKDRPEKADLVARSLYFLIHLFNAHHPHTLVVSFFFCSLHFLPFSSCFSDILKDGAPPAFQAQAEALKKEKVKKDLSSELKDRPEKADLLSRSMLPWSISCSQSLFSSSVCFS